MIKLNEDKRSELIAKGRRGQKEKDGKSRFEKRVKSKVSSSVRTYNEIDMNKLFKQDILDVKIQVTGETNTYYVTISYGGFLIDLKRQIDNQNGILNLRAIMRALVNAFNSDNVYIRCTCPDATYRQNYWLSVNNIIYGNKETRPSNITNPNNKLGPGCKHVMLVLSNNSWTVKVASVINNYIKYISRTRKKLYADIIYPAIYGKKFEEPVQLGIEDVGDEKELSSKKDVIDTSNEQGRVSGRFTAGNKYRFQPKNKPGKDQLEIEEEK